jgi:hypothetical protein
MTTTEVWPLNENMCLLHAMFFGLSPSEKSLFTCGGLYDPRELMRAVVPKKSKNFSYGASSNDAHNLIKKVVENNSLLGKSVKYVWKRQGQNIKGGHGWKVTDLRKTVLSKVGKYVIFGKAKQNSLKHIALIKKLKKIGNDDEVAAEWVKTANGHSAHNHGVGIIVSDDLSVKLIDNGCDNGCKLFYFIWV